MAKQWTVSSIDPNSPSIHTVSWYPDGGYKCTCTPLEHTNKHCRHIRAVKNGDGILIHPEGYDKLTDDYSGVDKEPVEIVDPSLMEQQFIEQLSFLDGLKMTAKWRF